MDEQLKSPTGTQSAGPINKDSIEKARPVYHAHDTSAETQCAVALAALRIRPRTTWELKTDHDIYDPCARVRDLRRKGFDIFTHWQTIETKPGRKHRIGKYCLMSEVQQGGSHG